MVIGLWYTWLVPFDYNYGFHQIPTVNGSTRHIHYLWIPYRQPRLQ
jgi:hypothetical protein